MNFVSEMSAYKKIDFNKVLPGGRTIKKAKRCLREITEGFDRARYNETSRHLFLGQHISIIKITQLSVVNLARDELGHTATTHTTWWLKKQLKAEKMCELSRFSTWVGSVSIKID